MSKGRLEAEALRLGVIGRETDLAKDPTGKDDRASPEKPRRKPVTIDLAAAEVGRKPAEVTSESSSAAAAEASASSTGAAEKLALSEPPKPAQEGSTKIDPVIPSAFAARDARTDARMGVPKADPPIGPQPSARPATSFGTLLLAALVGGVIVAAAVVALVLAGYLAPPSNTQMAAATDAEVASLKSEVDALKQAGEGVQPLKDQIAALERSVGELADRPPPSAPDPAALKDFSDRLAKLESAGAAGSTQTNLEPRIAELSQEISALKNAAPPDAASVQAELAALHQQLDALSASLGKLPKEDRIAAIEAKLGDSGNRLDEIAVKVGETAMKIGNATALAPAVAAEALQAALESGRPFQSELAALKSLGVDQAAADALAVQAESGLPTIADLRARFDAAVATVPLENPIPENTGAINRLLESAQGLVSVRPAHPTAGSDLGAIVSRVRGALAAGDLRSALAEWETLPDAIKTPSADWAKLAKARLAADDLVAGVRSDALAKLGAGN